MKQAVRVIFFSCLASLFFVQTWLLARVDLFFLTGASVVGQRDYSLAVGIGLALLFVTGIILSTLYSFLMKYIPVFPFLRAFLSCSIFALLLRFLFPSFLLALQVLFAQRVPLPDIGAHPKAIFVSTLLFTLTIESFLTKRRAMSEAG